jgi:hypothetical protein
LSPSDRVERSFAGHYQILVINNAVREVKVEIFLLACDSTVIASTCIVLETDEIETEMYSGCNLFCYIYMPFSRYNYIFLLVCRPSKNQVVERNPLECGRHC